MMPGAVAVGLTMPIAGWLADRYSPAWLTAAGCALVGSSLLLFGVMDPLSTWPILVWPQITRGIGLALMMAPLTAAALNAVPRSALAMASSFVNVSQNVGGSLGIALLNTFVTNSIHRHAVRLGETFPPESAGFMRFGFAAIKMNFRHAQGILPSPQLKAAYGGAQALLRHAQVLGFNNGFVLAGLILLAAIPLCLLLQPSQHHVDAAEKAAESLEAEYLAD
jgi:DHA2 family multidrug resistance protein